MSNPYSSPLEQGQSRVPFHDGQVKGPAIALIVVSSIALFFGLLGLAGDAFMIATGFVDRLEAMNEDPVSEYTQITIRIIWGIILIIASMFVLYGAIKMNNRKSFQVARAASIVAMIPMVGPCCILGIPFGIWAFVTLGKPGVKESFSS